MKISLNIVKMLQNWKKPESNLWDVIESFSGAGKEVNSYQTRKFLIIGKRVIGIQEAFTEILALL